ncbi:Glucose/arabinose dehydrogenase, beta-propeller fold [Kushneria avicenniae]|uniref:Glucose/arabinose dehydrogenase, beta-propeller fold n=1 Tax=Kushneria avicenniae TaxID=402385 RepID=A0A1I1LDZ4_9GAMM|nr:PQQ-dependent sugar dehydrogenase [Kushneria avicenniae]SFC71387.1 Glucose/arabinose dehydrogenase, beta-propeller fold [Kushneria avicenniae]
MRHRLAWPITATHFVAALLTGTLLGSIVQTQINLAALQQLGVDIPIMQRLTTTLGDLVTFSPVYFALFSVGFVISQIVALWISRRYWNGRHRLGLCTLSAMAALWATFHLVDHFAPMPTLIAATRTATGMAAMVLTAGGAGAVLAWLRGTSRHSAPTASSATIALLMIGAAGMTPASDALAQSEATDYRIETVAERLEHPWSLAFLPDGRMLVTERPGRLRLLNAGGETINPSLEGVPRVFASGQSGLFDVLLSPDFEQDRTLFLAYSCGTQAANHACLSRAVFSDTGLEQVEEIFRAQPAKRGNAHFGGRLASLSDGTLILTLGDGFDYREQAQNTANHIGAIVRLNPDGSVPADNPFVNDDTARPEILSYGHRNVQGLVVDEEDRILMHEHGPKGGDEVNLITPGGNYGWPIATTGLDYTGARVTPFDTYPGTQPPLLEWTPSIAPSGMTRYDGALFPQWQGDLLIGSLVDREVRRVTLSDDATRAEDIEGLFGELDERIRDVRTGPNGAVYLLTDSAEGRVLKVMPAQ